MKILDEPSILEGFIFEKCALIALPLNFLPYSQGLKYIKGEFDKVNDEEDMTAASPRRLR